MATDVVGYSTLMQSDEAKALSTLATIRQITTEQLKLDLFPIRRTEDYAKWEEGLRLAGLPE
jgi:hypothetical protein